MPRRGFFVFAHDIGMTFVAFMVSMYLRIGFGFLDYFQEFWKVGVTTIMIIAAVVYLLSGLYRGVWRYASLNDLFAIFRAVTITTVTFVVIMFLWQRLDDMPRSVLIINWFILMALLGGPRFVYRLMKDRHFDFSLHERNTRRIPVLLVGADDGAELFIRDMARAPDANYEVVGIVAEKSSRVGRRIHGVEVLGTTQEIESVVKRLSTQDNAPQRLILTKDDIDGPTVRMLLDRAAELGLTMARLPRLTDFRSGLEDTVEVRPVAIEDLLGRPQKALDRQAMQTLIEGKRVLVTGAGGSIGSELVRQICGFSPASIALLDYGEYNLYTIDMEVSRLWPTLKRSAVLADVRERDLVGKVFAAAKPELVFHAAALKHVPLVEAHPTQGAMTNVIGTANVADACRDHAVNAMVLISTDKAVNPSSIMGTTKRIAEIYCQAHDLDRRGDTGTRFITVRFGNVLGSTGSVVPLFHKQLQEGGPLTVTHPDMTRYFMTVREAVELVLEASALGCTDQRTDGKIFVLDMGEPVRIIDLARQMIRLAGLRPDEDVKIDIVGLRPGEKLREDVFHEHEQLMPTRYEGILLAAPRAVGLNEIRNIVTELADSCRNDDTPRLRTLIRQIVPEYQGRA
ncbi:MAG: nucleoside-diphosphate sugar epimerase/dehydratase [Rhodospirillales bacterium]